MKNVVLVGGPYGGKKLRHPLSDPVVIMGGKRRYEKTSEKANGLTVYKFSH